MRVERHSPLRPLMLVGTGSDVGKSVLATAFCRIFRRMGYHPAPFKAQNMSLNSYVTPQGHEMGRAQCVQAEAAGIESHSDMNPILLKPSGASSSQVILNGQVVGNRSAWDYYRGEGFPQLREAAHAAYRRLASRYNPMILEGAGSVSELNLAECDLANMPMAAFAGAAALLVADIERGGVFASLYGSLELMSQEHRALVKGIIINKFRGDARLFEKGREILERICHVPVLGVVPAFDDIFIEEEDSLALSRRADQADSGNAGVQVAVVKVPHMSNYTDFAFLERMPGVHLYYAQRAETLESADLIILPGSKNTIEDLVALRDNGMVEAILRAHGRGVGVLGICGGYQMLGLRVEDPEHVEGSRASIDGLGLLPVITRMSVHKRLQRVSFTLRMEGTEAQGEGYEVHMGRTEPSLEHGCTPLVRLEDGSWDGCSKGNVWGTYLHGFLDSEAVIRQLFSALLSPARRRAWLEFSPAGMGSYREFKSRQYDRLADHVEAHVDVARLIEILRQHD